jgi:ATP adenylyltransferase/5',5'''-P-1,P-4-tetraphosphate phosphorylase II
MGKVSQEQVNGLISRQMNDWSLAGNNYAALAGVKVKRFEVNGREVQVQFNPARIVSSAAKVDDKSLSERRCFLCAANRPVEQEGLAWGDLYTILVNPFPIFPRHLTIPSNNHKPQRIKGRIGDMLGLAADLHDFVIFYNGPKCGASAPDHCHFQAGSKGLMSLPAGKD